MNKKQTLVVHACGGGGISITDKALTPLLALGSGFANIEFNYIDTSPSNYNTLKDPKSDLWLIKPSTHGKKYVDGSGGDRAANAVDIFADVPNYLNERRHTDAKSGYFHVVVCTANGSSGSVIGPAIYQSLIKAGIPVFIVLVGDRKNYVYANHTVNVFASFDKIAKALKSACTIIYYNNSDADSADNNVAEVKVNNAIQNTIAGILAFIGGGVESVDYADMVNFFCMERYKNALPAKPGIYGLSLVQGMPKVPKDTIPMVARSASTAEISSNLDFEIYHQKQGSVIDENVLSKYEKVFPLHLITYMNAFQDHIHELSEYATASRSRLEGMGSIAFTGTDASVENDDLGIVL